jgi:hypothetical protein
MAFFPRRTFRDGVENVRARSFTRRDGLARRTDIDIGDS